MPNSWFSRCPTRYIDVLTDLEASHLYHLLQDRIPRAEATFLKSVAAVRNAVAHHHVVEASHIIALSEFWERIRSPRTNVRGWDWPRCGQQLVLMVGPSGAGKSTLAAQRHTHDSIVSSDAIRIEKYGSITAAHDQSEVFAEVQRRVCRRLANGDTVVVDATNLKQRDRLSIVGSVPLDLPVVYEVVDRPMADKIATGGWRLEREGLIEGHDEMFRMELPNILSGDERPNVEVIDLRRLAFPDSTAA
jgi:hypothetical protein